MTQIGFYYDQTRCAGCKTCQVACKDKNRLGVGPVLRKVASRQVGTYPAVKLYHLSASCNHCESPACMAKCPTGALSKTDEGAVVRDAEACIGCSSCVNACPYGHPQIDETTGLSVKCDACSEWRAAGYLPACVEACPYRALDFGDVEEPARQVRRGGSELHSRPGRGHHRLAHAHQGACRGLGRRGHARDPVAFPVPERCRKSEVGLRLAGVSG